VLVNILDSLYRY